MCAGALHRACRNNLHAGRFDDERGCHCAGAGGCRVVAHAAGLGRAAGVHHARICADGFFVICAAPLSYIGLGAGMPLQDARFVELDRLLGLDWPAYFHFAMARPELLLYAKFFYAMILVPAFGVPVVLGLTGQYIRLQQFVMASTLALGVVIVVSSLLPAIGTYFEFGLPSDTELFKANGYGGQARDIPMLRDGTLRALNLAKLGGILTFPSFHAATALLSIWSLWSIWWLRPALLMLNAGMLVATPLAGGITSWM
ncbi:hypothetical protein FXV83_33455 [Bradyrhizobium hipponense]|uniref:Inositolphosphotransferase Aur1/Ipt1 domain-containing protein n=1 Tax=Bradyrhizobium hipponense TaxID=2605638 RepID=A0A5S4YFB3_9BRAD|nr:hypothetical protein FXV83_33455 [Bradyrhizobium hipponense]